MSRRTCVLCRRPGERCVCDRVRAIDNRTGVTILQHPGERHHAFNTARLARAALRDVRLHVAWPESDGRLHRAAAVPEGAALLYPGPHAVDLGDLPPGERPGHLVVIDGTWAQARGVYRDNPWLHRLPHVRLSPARPSRYRIRREPAPHCLSTIESIAAALEVLEPETGGLSGLLDAFLAMVDTQADQTIPSQRRGKVRRRPNLVQRMARDWDRIVIGYAESREEPGGPALVQWAAVRPSTGAAFDARCGSAAFAERWAAFAGTDAVLVCWSPKAALLLRDATGRQTETICLRGAYGNLRGGVTGYLDEVTAREGCAVVPVAVSGRAGERLAYALALATLLRRLAGTV
jgi:DTW domain-containing protein YfiP